MRLLLVTAVSLAALLVLLHLAIPFGAVFLCTGWISGLGRLAMIWERPDQRGITIVMMLSLLAIMGLLTLWMPGAWALPATPVTPVTSPCPTPR